MKEKNKALIIIIAMIFALVSIIEIAGYYAIKDTHLNTDTRYLNKLAKCIKNNKLVVRL